MAGRIPQRLRGGRGGGGGGGGGEGRLREGDESLDLFSRIRRHQLSDSHNGSAHRNGVVSIAPEKAGIGSLGRSKMDDLLSADVGKHDYDWLLTPPGTPLFSFSETSDNNNPPTSKPTPTSRSNARSHSTGKASRLSVSQTENPNSSRHARSSSTTRSSISVSNNTFSSSAFYSNNGSSRTSALNTSTASVTSKPSTPGKSRAISTSPSQPATSRSSTPVKPRPSQNTRPCTPPVRPKSPATAVNAGLSAAGVRPNSRPSTPARRPSPAAPAPTITRSASVGRNPATNDRKSSPAARPSSPAPRTRTQAPPERAASAGRQRPSAALSLRASSNFEAAGPVSATRRQSPSPVSGRGRLQESASCNRMSSGKASEVKTADSKKSLAPEPAARRASKPASVAENTGFGRSISKKSMDMAVKHMDIRQSIGGLRGAALFPQSIRSTAQKIRPNRSSEQAAVSSPDKQISHPDDCEVSDVSSNNEGIITRGCNGDHATRLTNEQPIVARVSKLDVYESSRYDAILLKEDFKNMNWLHSIEDKCDQSPSFDYRFGSLPEPFGLI